MKKRDFVTSIWFPVSMVLAFAVSVGILVSAVDFSEIGRGIGKFGAAISEGYDEGRN